MKDRNYCGYIRPDTTSEIISKLFDILNDTDRIKNFDDSFAIKTDRFDKRLKEIKDEQYDFDKALESDFNKILNILISLNVTSEVIDVLNLRDRCQNEGCEAREIQKWFYWRIYAVRASYDEVQDIKYKQGLIDGARLIMKLIE